MTISILGHVPPASILNRGRYVYKPWEEMRVSGAGVSVVSGLAKLTWSFNSLSAADYAWWVTTVLAGNPSRSGVATLWDDLNAEHSFSSVTVRYPAYEEMRGNRYWSVAVNIDTMIP